MKTSYDNSRDRVIQGIASRLKEKNIKSYIYEPTLNEETFNECEIIKDFNIFKNKADVVLVNRMDEKVKELENKVYTRDIFSRD